MQVATTIEEYRRLRAAMTGTVGAVPTMGYLHDGHLALVRRARAENDHVVVSIFVNPTQFGPNEDYARYPRDPERDLAMLRAEGVDVVFMPSVEEMYPEGFATYVNVERLTERLEGAHRPGHFRGVTTVVTKLFNVLQAHRAYFGQKDAQQLIVIRRMTRDLAFPVEIVDVPTVREPDGLAMSSRNVYLSPDERRAATVLFRALERARELWGAGVRDGSRLRAAMREVVESEPLARADYVSVADPETLEELNTIEGRALASLAVRLGSTRLIDCAWLGT
ncbi:MAG TPA: pantoate--beta-alanine ligase [Dehalococcoidia bacterium]|nr:pantoate--beta-alanine ligase [Dehalococcoidia bacterium]